MKNKIIGIIGGMGPQASAELYRLLIEGAKREYGARNNDDFPEILIDSVPVPDFLSYTREMEKAAVMLEDRTRRLTGYGASIISIACNTACLLIDRLQQQTSVPFTSVVDEVARKVSFHHTHVLLLASPTSLRLGLYQKALSRYGVSYALPSGKYYKELEYIIRGVIEGAKRDCLTKKLVRIVEKSIEKQSVDGIVLGCTELPLVFPAQYRLPVYNSLSILAESLLKRYYNKEVV
ncbi:MAG: amino acid racemase [Candidatus Gottesmanbacteria bacterium]|nr:amino acid racemase [Candidatus Gottesmanbacteria bacterium]